MLAIRRETDYAIHLLKFLVATKGHYVSLTEMATATGISFTFLQKIARKLRLAKLVKSNAGVNGGYILNLPANQISLKQIIEAVEGNSLIVPCLCHKKGSTSKCIKTANNCTLKSKMLAINNKIIKIFTSVKLSQL